MKTTVLSSVLLLIVSGCSTNGIYYDSPCGDSELKYLIVGVRDIDISAITRETKATISITNAVSFSWSEGDVLGIFPDKGGQVDFEVAGESGNTAKFDGGAWALKSAHKYSVYYPYAYENRDRTALQFNYSSQFQTAKNDYSHLIPFQYLASGAITPENGYCNFILERLASTVIFQLTVPVSGTYDHLNLEAVDGTPIVISNTVDISGGNYVIGPASTAPAFDLGLDNLEILAGEVVTFYAMIPPQNLTGKQLRLSLTTNDGIVSETFFSGREFINNHAYKYTKVLSSDIYGRGEDALYGGVWDN